MLVNQWRVRHVDRFKTIPSDLHSLGRSGEGILVLALFIWPIKQRENSFMQASRLTVKSLYVVDNKERSKYRHCCCKCTCTENNSVQCQR